MTNPTACEVIATWLKQNVGGIDGEAAYAGELETTLDRAGKEIVDKGAVAREREECALITLRWPFKELTGVFNIDEVNRALLKKAAAIRARGKE